MNNIIKKIRANEFISHVVSLITGTGLAQIITLAISPLLTRIYTPGDFGQFYIFLALSSLFTIFVTGSLEKAIIIKRTTKESTKIAAFTVGVIQFFLILSLVIYPAINQFFVLIFHKNIAFKYYLLFLLYSSLQGGIKVFQSLNNRKKQYKTIAFSNIIKAGLIAITQLTFGWFGFGPMGLVLGGFSGSLLSLVYLLYNNTVSYKRLNIFYLKSTIPIIKKHYDFIFFSMPTTLINELSNQLPLLVFKTYFGQISVGFYSLTQRVLSQPIQFVGKSVSDIFFRESAEIENKNLTHDKLAFKTFKGMFLLGVIPFSILMLFGEPIFAFVFGSNWEQSGLIASLLSPWMLLYFSGSPLLSLFFTQRRLHLYFLFNLVLLVLRGSALSIGVFLFNDFIIATALFGLVGFFYWVFIILFTLKQCGVRIANVVKFIIGGLIIPLTLLALKLSIWT